MVPREAGEGGGEAGEEGEVAGDTRWAAFKSFQGLFELVLINE